MNVTAIILAGGKSTRYGEDKTLLEWDGGLLMSHLVHKLQALCDEILIISNATCKFNILGTRELKDIYPGCGPLGGIHAGLDASTNPLTLVVACDMPLISIEFAEHLLRCVDGFDIVVPREEKRVHPLFGIYARRVLPVAERILKGQSYSVLRLLDETHTRYIDRPDWPQSLRHDLILANINKKEDYVQIKNTNNLSCK